MSDTEQQETVATERNKGGRPRKDANANVPLQEVYEVAVKKALTSSSASERTQALAQAGAMLTPTLGELRAKIKELEDAREATETALKTAQTTLDAANTELVPLREQVAKVAPMEAELADLKANLDARVSEARKELVEEAQQERFKAQRAEYAATEKLREAQSQFGQKGLQLLLDEVKKIVEQYSVSEPDPATLPNGISPLFLTLWGHSAIRSQLMIGYSKSFPEPNEAFKNTLLRVLRARLPLYEGTVPSDPVPEIDVKQAVLTAMARKWNVLEEIQKRNDAEAVQRQANFLRNHHAMMHSVEQDAARRGEGRSPIGEAESVSGVPLSEHLPMCVCKICSPNLKRPVSLDVIGGEESF
jgi:hypothetical protein